MTIQLDSFEKKIAESAMNEYKEKYGSKSKDLINRVINRLESEFENANCMGGGLRQEYRVKIWCLQKISAKAS